MKTVVLLVTLLTLISCGRESEKLLAPRNTFDFQNDFTNFGTRGATLDNFHKTEYRGEMRDATILVFPQDKDLEGFVFKATPERKAAWDAVYAKLKSELGGRPRYNPAIANFYRSEFGSGWTGQQVVRHLVGWISVTGRVRDDAHRDRGANYVEKLKLEPEVDKLVSDHKRELKKTLKPYVCFSRGKEGGKEKCSQSRSSTYKRKKTPRKCRDLNKYEFEFADADAQTRFDAEFSAAKTACSDLMTKYDSDVKPKVDRLKVLDTAIEPYNVFREYAKSVVLDLLEQAEDHSNIMYIGAVSTHDKKIDCPGVTSGDKCLSTIKFSTDKRAIEELKIYASFGSWVSDDKKIENRLFSLENGGIHSLEFNVTDQGVPYLVFTLEHKDSDLSDGDSSVRIDAQLSMSDNNQDKYMALRFVGETKVYLPNGEWRRGVMKLEFDKR